MTRARGLARTLTARGVLQDRGRDLGPRAGLPSRAPGVGISQRDTTGIGSLRTRRGRRPRPPP